MLLLNTAGTENMVERDSTPVEVAVGRNPVVGSNFVGCKVVGSNFVALHKGLDTLAGLHKHLDSPVVRRMGLDKGHTSGIEVEQAREQPQPWQQRLEQLGPLRRLLLALHQQSLQLQSSQSSFAPR